MVRVYLREKKQKLMSKNRDWEREREIDIDMERINANEEFIINNHDSVVVDAISMHARPSFVYMCVCFYWCQASSVSISQRNLTKRLEEEQKFVHQQTATCIICILIIMINSATILECMDLYLRLEQELY